jgi:hypothetical protein
VSFTPGAVGVIESFPDLMLIVTSSTSEIYANEQREHLRRATI